MYFAQPTVVNWGMHMSYFSYYATDPEFQLLCIMLFYISSASLFKYILDIYFVRSTYDYRIVAGDHLLYSPEDTEQKLLVQQFIPHPAYSPNTEENDIMLIYLAVSVVHVSSIL